MSKLKPFVTDEQWIRLEPWRPKPQPSAKDGPEPRGNREVFDGMIRLLPTGAGWNDLADQYPSASTCWSRLQPWEEPGVWLKIWPKFLSELNQQGQLDWPETLADGSLAWAEKGAQALERPKAERVASG
ncbi:MAG: transposase [Candidatus Poribacteria bacterium]|nr:transposase [Candidatus Poribacteria bacterium]MDP6996313.1 transposase [Candidatus Poribacteria bacterium]